MCPRIQCSSHGGREDFSSLVCVEFPGEPGGQFSYHIHIMGRRTKYGNTGYDGNKIEESLLACLLWSDENKGTPLRSKNYFSFLITVTENFLLVFKQLYEHIIIFPFYKMKPKPKQGTAGALPWAWEQD